MNYLKRAWALLVRSSADPRKTSLFVKSTLLGFITIGYGYLVQGLDIVCQFGERCYYLDPTVVDQVRVAIDAIAEGVYFALMFVATIGIVWGAVRKIWLTAIGKNRVLDENL